MISTLTKDDTIGTYKKPDHEMKDSLNNAAHNAGHSIRSAINSASTELSHAGEVATTEIRTNPVRSSLLALGVGLLLGGLLRR